MVGKDFQKFERAIPFVHPVHVDQLGQFLKGFSSEPEYFGNSLNSIWLALVYLDILPHV